MCELSESIDCEVLAPSLARSYESDCASRHCYVDRSPEAARTGPFGVRGVPVPFSCDPVGGPPEPHQRARHRSGSRHPVPLGPALHRAERLDGGHRSHPRIRRHRQGGEAKPQAADDDVEVGPRKLRQRESCALDFCGREQARHQEVIVEFLEPSTPAELSLDASIPAGNLMWMPYPECGTRSRPE